MQPSKRTVLGWAPAAGRDVWHRWEQYPEGRPRRAVCLPYLEPAFDPLPEEQVNGRRCRACLRVLSERPFFASVLEGIRQLGPEEDPDDEGQ